jgi:hypothetical protein
VKKRYFITIFSQKIFKKDKKTQGSLRLCGEQAFASVTNNRNCRKFLSVLLSRPTNPQTILMIYFFDLLGIRTTALNAKSELAGDATTELLLPCALENGKNFYLCCKSNYLVIFD